MQLFISKLIERNLLIIDGNFLSELIAFLYIFFIFQNLWKKFAQLVLNNEEL